MDWTIGRTAADSWRWLGKLHITKQIWVVSKGVTDLVRVIKKSLGYLNFLRTRYWMLIDFHALRVINYFMNAFSEVFNL